MISPSVRTGTYLAPRFSIVAVVVGMLDCMRVVTVTNMGISSSDDSGVRRPGTESSLCARDDVDFGDVCETGSRSSNGDVGGDVNSEESCCGLERVYSLTE